MHPFDHFTPESLPDALALLQQHNGQARLIAGGTDLLLKMRAGLLSPATVINIKRLPELKGISYDAVAGLRLGALTTLRELIRSQVIQAHYPVLAQAAGLMASEQIRSLATVGGNLCNAAPSADMAPPLMALGATAVLVSLTGERHLPLEQFFTGPGRTVIGPGELLQAVHLPPPQGRTIYLRQTPRAYMDIAVVGTAVHLEQVDGRCHAVRIVLGAVALVPLRAAGAEAVLTGQPLLPENILAAAQTAAAECAPIDDIRSSAWYRRRLVALLVRRALEEICY
jgi:aerobic carbon-monoxide dehydrogenase medium subunit